MTEVQLSDLVAAASAYEGLHVPALFEEWTGPVLDAAAIAPGDRVLDVACGTGVLARAAAARVGPALVTGLDPGPGMLAVAAEIAPGIEWQPGVAEDLPFPDATFDAVVSQFGLMFFGDRGAAIREMGRVLIPGGRFAVAVWDSLENTPAYAAEVELFERMAGPDAAAALRAPFVMGNAPLLQQMFADIGFAEVEIIASTGTGRFPSVRTMVEADLRGWLPIMGVRLDEDTIERILCEAEVTLDDFVDAEGRVVFDSPALIVRGRREL